MNMNDYKNAVSRMHTKPELETEVINMSIKHDKKHFGKKTVIPIAIAAVCLSTCTFAFADDIAGIFRKTNSLEMNINTESIVSEDIKTVPLKKSVMKKWDENVIKELFFGDRTVTESEIYPSDMNPEIDRKFYRFDDDTNICYEDGDIIWSYSQWLEYNYGYHISILENLNFDKASGEMPFGSSDLEGLDKNESAALADSYIEKLGIPVKDRQSFTFDAETLISEDKARDENGNRIYKHGEILPEWTKEQEAYLFVYNVGNGNDISLSPTESLVYVVIGRNGMAQFYAGWIYETVETDETVQICSVEEAAEAVCEYFSKEPSMSPMLTENCELVYRPEKAENETEYILKPYWEFYSTSFVTWLNEDGTNDGFEKGYAIAVDAQTGEFVDLR